ncbi:hypothetical protein CDL12_06452 [Handroanthus impetiginosus]|uniref:Uncharacterized protein n=1 Tax=Handroanthus impetiginosus TaxID=429701 RepID=A0A2G9HTK1_9LAMI|nr:hypothetical protein CDL12_06452 [Handroanthus impetiginosus]
MQIEPKQLLYHSYSDVLGRRLLEYHYKIRARALSCGN